MSRRSDRRGNPLGHLGQPIDGAKPCMRCSKPHTNRVFIIEGDFFWLVKALSVFLDEHDPAVVFALAQAMFEECGLHPVTDATARNVHLVRLCRGCAAKTDAPVYSLDSLKRLAASAECFRVVAQPPSLVQSADDTDDEDA